MLNIEGPSGVGKSVFVEIAEAMIPEKYRASIPLGQEKSSNFDFESVTRAKLITVHEAGKAKIANSETVKALITGNTTSIDRKGKQRLDIKCKANMIVVSNDPLALDSKSDPKSTAARILIIKAEGISIRDTDMEIHKYGQVIWDKEGSFLMIYLLGMWRWASCGKGAMWREWSEPARESALETAYEAMPDLRFIKDFCEITNDRSDTISLLEFADIYKSFRNDQGRSNFEYGKDHARETWKKFDAKRLHKTTVTYKTQRYPSNYVVTGVRWKIDNFPVSDIQDLLITVN
jgi:phage/plasmid-associated DNA primase